MVSKQLTKVPLKIEQIINFQQYPIADLSQQKSLDIIANCRQQLESRGCCVFKNFLTPQALFLAQQESFALENEAYYATRNTNIFKTDDDPTLPPEHPARFFMERTNGFVPLNKFHPQSLFLTLYRAKTFQNLIAACLASEPIYEYSDPLAGLVLNILRQDAQHPWHYDENDFSVVLMIQAASAGGIFEYAPHIRTLSSENYELVNQVLHGYYQDVEQNQLQPGDLQIFQGKLSLHRVTKVAGNQKRYTAIFSYTKENNAMATAKYSEALFGKAISPTARQTKILVDKEM
ncbi:MAG: hypothetical protein KI793_02380 [Rivularia sp. (in: Bacteria)]|nr:hypothetical protein [Rivularia sp. MS3]